MTGSLSVRRNTTAFSSGSPAHQTPENGQASTPDVSNGNFRVTAGAAGWDVELRTDDTWVVVGTYADQDVADEIVQIANSAPDRNSFNGESPDSAIPFSAFRLDDDGDLSFLEDGTAQWL
jgi:hypothetical protein